MNNGFYPTPQRTLPPSQIPGQAIIRVPVRQTAISGPIDSNGLPSFLPASATGLALPTQNITDLTPLVITAALGFDPLLGMLDVVGATGKSIAWNNLTNTTTNYLYLDILPDGTLLPGSTTLIPVYQWGGTRSTSAGQFTFNVQEMYGTVGDGSNAGRVRRVFVGEAVTSGGNVTSTIAYAYQGRYDSGFTSTLPALATTTTKNSNLGFADNIGQIVLECITGESGYVTGDRAVGVMGSNGSVFTTCTFGSTRNTCWFTTGNSGGPVLINKTTGAPATLTLANWKYKLVVQRTW